MLNVLENGKQMLRLASNGFYKNPSNPAKFRKNFFFFSEFEDVKWRFN